jgi:hypothetical protein
VLLLLLLPPPPPPLLLLEDEPWVLLSKLWRCTIFGLKDECVMPAFTATSAENTREAQAGRESVRHLLDKAQLHCSAMPQHVVLLVVRGIWLSEGWSMLQAGGSFEFQVCHRELRSNESKKSVHFHYNR